MYHNSYIKHDLAILAKYSSLAEKILKVDCVVLNVISPKYDEIDLNTCMFHPSDIGGMLVLSDMKMFCFETDFLVWNEGVNETYDLTDYALKVLPLKFIRQKPEEWGLDAILLSGCSGKVFQTKMIVPLNNIVKV